MVERKSYEQLIGTIVGNYRVERLLERHPWGPIFLASTQDKKSVLLRFLELPRSAEQLDANARLIYLGLFQQEANHVASLQHPHILTLLDYGNHLGIPFLVYPSLSLVSLRALISQGGPMHPLTAGQYLRQISTTLEYAHERAVIHRNLSTSCIFLYNKQQLLISEFGMLRMREVAQLANSGQGSGNLTYEQYEGSSESSSPEQLQNQSVDTYSDVYASGAILYRMLTGRPPFSGPTREAIVEQHLYAEVPPLRRWRSDLPLELDQVISKAMAKEPHQRFRRPGELTLAYYQIVAPGQLSTANIASGPLGTGSGERTPSATLRQEKQPTVIRPDATRAAKQPDASRRRMMATLVSSATGIGIAALLLKFGPQFLHPTAANGSTANNGAPAQATQPPAQVKATQSATKGAKVLARTTDVPLNSAKTFTIANQKNPGLLIHLPNNQFVAYDSTCTHEQCAVDYNKQSKMLECPCHGAVFDPAQKGAVVQPPAPKPLTSIKIAVNSDGTITEV